MSGKIPVFYDEGHVLHDPKTFEAVERAINIHRRLQNEPSQYFIQDPFLLSMEHLLLIQNQDYVDYLRDLCSELKDGELHHCEIFAYDRKRKPKTLKGQIGWYCYEATTGVCKYTYQASLNAVYCALSGASILKGSNSTLRKGEEHQLVYSLCRPPGHHATRDRFGGYCYFNNAAIAANYLTFQFPDQMKEQKRRVVVLDIDFHGGNGTQEIFYERDDVFVVSIHGHPDEWLGELYFWGFEDEVGEGKGKGFNLNLPIRAEQKKVDYPIYKPVLISALKRCQEFNPDFLVISWGVDTSVHDSLGIFSLTDEDYFSIGKEIKSALPIPTLVVQEGGYHEHLGECTHQFLQGLKQ
eukprot:TRINITY_DN1675_c0_g1_i1.p1 TRINITY_DN1675_c0_g1~~TRINITY_DN1675_c0_g1_i1.p1  ORF type:complete len:404 (-),score=67.05 TRINITY_DN1675_c0_g1_i1:44-1102(-)